MTDVLLGFEIGTGAEVRIPLAHTAVTGQSQLSGKTTTLEGLITRSGQRALAFVTKRGERSFPVGRGQSVPPYFRDHADWQFVDQLLEAQLGEKNKFLRPWIIRICRSTKTLADVHREVKKALAKAKGIHEGVYTQLDAYLELIVPEIGRAELADRLALGPGLNVMDVSSYPTPMQMLFVRSAIEWINEREESVITVIPEAWEFVPERKGSPVKSAAIGLIRKGGGLRNFLFADSQDTAGIDKTILRGCPVWLIGVQREANEIKRNLDNIPASIQRPKAADVATLKLGQFYACWGERTVKVYVQPAWMEAETARRVARGEASPATRPLPMGHRGLGVLPVEIPNTPLTIVNTKEDPSMCEEHGRLAKELEALKQTTARERERLERDIAAVRRECDEATIREARLGDQLTGAKGRLEAADRVGQLVARLVSPFLEGPVREGGGPPFDEDGFLRKVLARLPAGGGAVVQVTPPDKLRRDFQQEEVDRIVKAVTGLTPLQKRTLKLLETTEGEFVGQPALAQRLGRSTTSGGFGEFGRSNQALADLGFVEAVPRQGVRKKLREKIAADLAFYKATEAEVEQTYQQVLYALATEGE